MTPALRLHAFVPVSRANGPGTRSVLWTQGCSLGCPGCFNPETHSSKGGTSVTADALFERILAQGDRIEGVTVSGGEPLQQVRALLPLLQRLRRETSLSVLLLTGYEVEEVRHLAAADALLDCLDVLVAGRYDASRKLALGLRGSSNKSAHFLTTRYGPADLQAVAPAELIITPEGELISTGVDPVAA